MTEFGTSHSFTYNKDKGWYCSRCEQSISKGLFTICKGKKKSA